MTAEGTYPKSLEGKEIRFSASSQETYRLCNRRWWFQKVKALPEPPSESLSYGTAVHLVLETYLKGSGWLDAGEYRDGREVVHVTGEHVRRAKLSAPHLPEPGTYVVEAWLPALPLVTVDGVTMRVSGKIDAYDFPEEGDPPHLIDHKTSSNARKYGKRGDDLRRDPQGHFYLGALAAMHGWEGVARFSHNTICKSTDTVLFDTVLVEYDDVARSWDRSKEAARAMIQLAAESTQDVVPFNLGACRAFGRDCPFKDACTARRSPRNPFAALAGAASRDTSPTPQAETPAAAPGGPVSIFDRLGARPAAPATPTPTAPPAETKPVTPVGSNAIVSREAPPMDVSSPAFVQEVAEILVEALSDVKVSEARQAAAGILADEGLAPAWLPNVLVLAFGADYGALTADERAAAAGLETDALLATPLAAAAGLEADAEVLADAPAEVVEVAVETRTVAERAVLAERGAQVHAGEVTTGAFDTTYPWHAESDDRTRAALDALGRLLRERGSITRADLERTMSATWTRPRTKRTEEIWQTLAHFSGGLATDTVLTLDAPTAVDVGRVALAQAVQANEAPEPRAEVAQTAPAPRPAPRPPPAPTPTNAPEDSMTVILVHTVASNVTLRDVMSMPIVASAVSRVADDLAEKGHLDWRLYSDYADNGPKRVVGRIRQALARGETLAPGFWTIDRNNALIGAELLGTLSEVGAIVVRGVM